MSSDNQSPRQHVSDYLDLTKDTSLSAPIPANTGNRQSPEQDGPVSIHPATNPLRYDEARSPTTGNSKQGSSDARPLIDRFLSFLPALRGFLVPTLRTDIIDATFPAAFRP